MDNNFRDNMVFDVRESAEYADNLNTRKPDRYTEDFNDIDLNYPITDELDDMDSFLIHYRAFVDKVDGHLSGLNTITLYGIYMAYWSC